MFIKSLKIFNFKSFGESEEIEFDPHINLIVGTNNSGKSALLQAVSLQFSDNPHLSSVPSDINESVVHTKFRVSAAEFNDVVARDQSLTMPLSTGDAAGIHQMARNALGSHLDVTAKSSGKNKFSYYIYYDPARANYFDTNAMQDSIRFQGIKKLEWERTTSGARASMKPTAEQLIENFAKNFFYFSGERMNLHTGGIGRTLNLNSDGSNLAVVLHTLATEKETTFRRYLELVSRVLPNVKYVSIELVPESSSFTIKIRTSQDENIKFPLSECGTGIGQVLVMLYVICIAVGPSVIVIDEPNSFLHPAASRELITIFKEHDEHQYFISTHSPEIFGFVKPRYFTKLSYEDGRSISKRLPLGELGIAYQELGISPFYSTTMWVEGPTEVLIFPEIIDNPDIAYLPLFSVDEMKSYLKKGRLERLLKIYHDITQSEKGDPYESSIKFLVDGEHLTGAFKDEVGNRPDGMIHFLSRKMVENYFLHPQAITFVINHYVTDPVSEDEISQQLKECEVSDSSEVQMNVHGARILEAIFQSHKCEYQKTTHGPEIVNWIVQHDSSFLDPLRQEINAVING